MIKLYDRVKQTTYSIGTGDIALSGAIAGFSTFSSVYQNNDSLFYCVTDGINYEIGSGTYVSSSDTIKRYSIKSTNSNQLVNFGYGLKEIYVNYPATNSVFSPYGISSTPQNSGIAFWSSSNSISYSDKFNIDSGNGRIGINKTNPIATIDIGGSSATSSIRASGFAVGNSGIYFPSGNNGLSSYSGGIQLTHFEMNKTDVYSSSVIQLSGIVNQNILLKKQNAGTVFAGPPSGCSPPCDPAYPNFRPLTIEDIPDLSSIYANNINATNNVIDGRLSLSSTDPAYDGVSTSLYFVPYNGNSISLYNGTRWSMLKFSSTLVSNYSSLSANTMYDIFAYNNNGNIAFELVVWQMEHTAIDEPGSPDPIRDQPLQRIVSLSKIDGILCKSTNNTRRYIGSIRTSSSGFIDNQLKRFVYNSQNKVEKTVKGLVSVNGWVSLLDYWQPISSIPSVEVINGLDSSSDPIELYLILSAAYYGSEDAQYSLSLFSMDAVGSVSNNYYITSPQDQFPYYNLYSNIDDIFLTSQKSSQIKYSSISKWTYLDYASSHNITAYLKRIPYGHTRIFAIESATAPIKIETSQALGNYGIMGTYKC
jgi:hypothetical protein